MKEKWFKNTVVFMIAQAVSIFGSTLVQHAITWYVTIETKSGIYTTISIICGFLPILLLSPFSGVWADKYNRKTLIMISDGCIALSTLVLSITFILGHGSIWLLFATSAVRGFGQAVQTPCVGAMLPDIVPKDQLTRVGGLNGAMQSFIMLFSPMLAGTLMGFMAIEYILLIDVVTAIIGIVIMLIFLKIPKKVASTEQIKSNFSKEMKLGFKYILKHPYLKSFFGFMAIFCVFVAPAAFLTPLQVTRIYGDSPWLLPSIEISWAVGMLVGGVLITVWQGFKNRVHTMGFAFLLMGVFTIALGVDVNFWMYVVFMGLFGITMPFFNTSGTVLLQEKVDPDYLGRIFSVMSMINSAMMPLGMIIFGPLADIMPISFLLIGTGVIIMFISLLMFKNKPLIEAGVWESAN